jgi:hypothetical protein
VAVHLDEPVPGEACLAERRTFIEPQLPYTVCEPHGPVPFRSDHSEPLEEHLESVGVRDAELQAPVPVPLLPRLERAVVFTLVPRERRRNLVEPTRYDVDRLRHEPRYAGTVEETPQLTDHGERVVEAVPEAKLAPKPANLSFVQAAAMPVSGVTPLQALRDQGGVRAGHKVLVIGASGGVGTFAVQIAKTLGAQVTAVCSPGKAVIFRSTGADRVLDYTREDFAADGPIHDVIIDIGGNSPLSRLRRALTPTGTLVITGGETDGRWLGGNDRQVRALLLSPFISQTLRTFVASENHHDLAVLTQLAETGKIAPVLDRVYPLADAATAIQHVADGRARGKVVLDVRPTDHTAGGGSR